MNLSNLLTQRRALLLTLLGIIFGFLWGAKAINFTTHSVAPSRNQVRFFIAGAENLTPKEVLDYSFGSAVTEKIDLVTLSLRIEKHPRIENARAVLIPPDRVVIGVTERNAAGWVRISGEPWWVDEDGLPFAPVNKTQPVGVEIIGITNIVSGAKHPLLHQGLSLARQARQFPALAGLHAVRVAGGEASRLPELIFGKDTVRVVLGGNQIDEKLKRLAAIFTTTGTNTPYGNEIDLRFGNWMVFRSIASNVQDAKIAVGGYPSQSRKWAMP